MAGETGSDSDGGKVAGVTDLLACEQVDGVELCSLTYLSTSLPFARSALVPGLMGDHNLLPLYGHWFTNFKTY